MMLIAGKDISTTEPIITFRSKGKTISLFAETDNSNLIDCWCVKIGSKTKYVQIEKRNYDKAWKQVYNLIKPYL